MFSPTLIQNNSPLLDRESFRDHSSSVPADVSGTPGQVSKLKQTQVEQALSIETKELSEYITDAAWQLGLVNRYLFDKGFKHGVGTFFWEGIAPGTVSIANDISKDLMDVVKDDDEKGLRSTKFMPLLGRPYYDRFGRGHETSLERNE